MIVKPIRNLPTKHWDGILYDKANGVNLFTSGNMVVSGGINYVTITPSQFYVKGSGGGGLNANAYSNEIFNLKGFKTLRLTGTCTTVIPNYGGYFHFGISKADTPTTFLGYVGFSLNRESNTFNLTLNIADLSLNDIRILFYMNGNYNHFSDLYITKMWVEK